MPLQLNSSSLLFCSINAYIQLLPYPHIITHQIFCYVYGICRNQYYNANDRGKQSRKGVSLAAPFYLYSFSFSSLQSRLLYYPFLFFAFSKFLVYLLFVCFSEGVLSFCGIEVQGFVSESELGVTQVPVVFKTDFSDLTYSMSNFTCGVHNEESGGCRNNTYALLLKMIAIAAILTAGSCGVGIPLVGNKSRFLQTDSNVFVATKAFGAGVILATGFVHMLPDATSALTDSCLPQFPWSEFPFSVFIAMMAALATLLAELAGTRYHERKQEKQTHSVLADELEFNSESGIISEEDEGDAIHINVHPKSNEYGECEGKLRENSHSHWAGNGDEDDDIRHIVVSQILELGIVSHSFIIGLSLGVSHSPCTVRPLIGALSFHQFFEGLALGSCISQAKFTTLRSTIMASFFSLTAPAGIVIGIVISSIYNADSPRALVTEGIFDSISAGILVYMALVDLIAADFLGKRMSCSLRLQAVSYVALLLGAVSMSSLAVWA